MRHCHWLHNSLHIPLYRGIANSICLVSPKPRLRPRFCKLICQSLYLSFLQNFSSRLQGLLLHRPCSPDQVHGRDTRDVLLAFNILCGPCPRWHMHVQVSIRGVNSVSCGIYVRRWRTYMKDAGNCLLEDKGMNGHPPL